MQRTVPATRRTRPSQHIGQLRAAVARQAFVQARQRECGIGAVFANKFLRTTVIGRAILNTSSLELGRRFAMAARWRAFVSRKH